MFKKIGLLAIAMTMMLSIMSLPALADDDSRAVIGADLTTEQIEKVYGYFGVARGDVAELTVTNAEERKYLSWLVSEDQLGTLSISSAYIKILDEGSGISVATHNIDWVTSDMYKGALLTAGIYDAKIIVAAPFDVSGTAGLLGIYKAYEDISGTTLDDLAKQAGLQELFVSGSISEFIGSDSSTYLIEQLKLILDETKDMTDAEVKEQILAIADSQNIELTDANADQIVALSRTLEGLDVSELQARLAALGKTFDTVKETTGGIKSFFDSVGDFFAPMATLIENAGKWFSNLFDGEN